MVFLLAGTDVAGEVVDVAPGVKDFKIGDKVVAVLSHLVFSLFDFFSLGSSET